MIRITIELLPFGSEKHKKTIATGTIINDGTGDITKGNYDFAARTDEGFSVNSKVRNYPRLEYNVWKLLLEC